MYTPEHSINLSTLSPADMQIRLLLQGFPGTGKTYSAATFPNVVIADFDNKLGVHSGKNIIKIPFYDENFIVNILKYAKKQAQHPPNRRDAFQKWIHTEALKLTKEQTLIIDSWSMLQDAFGQQTDLEPAYTKSGGIDEYAFWERKITYSEDICTVLKSLNCNVIVCCHEQIQRDAQGNPTSKLEPLMQGKFGMKFAGYFTDHFRCVVVDKLGADNKPIMNGKEKLVERFWQTKSDSGVNLNCSCMGAPMFMIPTYEELMKYRTAKTI